MSKDQIYSSEDDFSDRHHGHVDDGETWCDFEEHDEFILCFNVELDRSTLQFANAFVDRCNRERLNLFDVIRVAQSLRLAIGYQSIPETEAARQWNEGNPFGTGVQYWPFGRAAESFLGRTASPAIDTPSGPVVLVDGHQSAVLLRDVQSTENPGLLS